MANGFTTEGGIRFEPVKGERGDYKATKGGIEFNIVRSTTGFGISAYKHGKGIAERLGGISWRGSRKNCATWADMLLSRHGEPDVMEDEKKVETASISTLTHAVQRRETGGGGGQWWHTMAAFDCEPAAIAYLERMRPLTCDHRILPVAPWSAS